MDEVFRIEHPKLISAYQGRLYEAYGIYDGKKASFEGMRDYFSEGFREFYQNPSNLLNKDPRLYIFIDGIGK